MSMARNGLNFDKKLVGNSRNDAVFKETSEI